MFAELISVGRDGVIGAVIGDCEENGRIPRSGDCINWGIQPLSGICDEGFYP